MQRLGLAGLPSCDEELAELVERLRGLQAAVAQLRPPDREGPAEKRLGLAEARSGPV